MNSALNIPISEFDYELPENRIAKYPLAERNLSKLLVYKNGNLSEDCFKNISGHIPSDSLLVINNTRVVHARLEFFKSSGSRIEIFCLEPHLPSDYSLSFSQKQHCQWRCIVGNLKKWKNETLYQKTILNSLEASLSVSLIQSEKDSHIIEFEWKHSLTFAEILEAFGKIPIPPYLNRKSETEDDIRYQTVYSEINGSVAAPTAGLHFTEKEFTELKNKGIKTSYVTLHVGAGTFLPVKTEILSQHSMHTEHFMVSLDLIQNLIKSYPEIIAVGTTSVRTLESLVQIGKMIENGENSDYFHVNQWDAYEDKNNIDPIFALKNIEKYLINNQLSELKASTSIMIVPGYKFRMVKSIVTNFHQPKSTLLALVCAFIGKDWRKVYSYALENDFRFLSYGDSSILFP